MDNPSFGYNSPIFCIPENADDHLRTYMKLLDDADDREFVLSLITTALDTGVDLYSDGSRYLDYKQLREAVRSTGTKIAIGKTTVRQRADRLQGMGLFVTERLTTPSLRGFRNALILQSPNALVRSDVISEEPAPRTLNAPKKRGKEYYAAIRRTKDRLADKDIQILESPKELKRAHSERLLNNVFFGCGRMSSRDPRRKKIVTVYPFQDERITVTATAGGDTDLFCLEDQNTVLAIITLVILSHSQQSANNVPLSSIPNEYYMDICDLTQICGLEPTGANRETLRKSLDRLYHSNLHVACSKDSQFAQYFGLYSSMGDGREFHPDDLNFRFISALDAVSEADPLLSKARRPRYYRISLHPIIHRQLLDKGVWSTFVVDPELVRNRLRLLTHLYFFAARNIHRDPNKIRQFPIETVHKYTMPAYTRFDNWKRSLFNEFKRLAKSQDVEWSEGGTCVLELFGYFVKTEPHILHGHLLTFWFNSNHPLLGKPEPLADTSPQQSLEFQDQV